MRTRLRMPNAYPYSYSEALLMPNAYPYSYSEPILVLLFVIVA